MDGGGVVGKGIALRQCRVSRERQVLLHPHEDDDDSQHLQQSKNQSIHQSVSNPFTPDLDPSIYHHPPFVPK